jgi:ubiquinone/menaquinone biosynthesis C-methylase UbiE
MSAAAKAYKGVGMQGFIARWYSRNTAKSMPDFVSDARRVAAMLQPGDKVLEVAPGPGYFAIELAKLGDYHVTGLDISRTFVEIARRNAGKAKVDVDFQLGNASRMPFETSQFDFLFCRAAFKNFSEPGCALQEMHRVLKPGGRGLIIDLRGDAPLGAINEAVGRMGLGVCSAWLTRMAFRFMLIKRAYKKAEFEKFLAQTQFRSVRIDESPLGFEIWLEK